MPTWRSEWEVKAMDQDSFKLYEAACLLERTRPVWPIPSDEIERRYGDLVEFTARTLRPSAFNEWKGNVNDFEIDRRRIRQYVERRCYHDYSLPWYLNRAGRAPAARTPIRADVPAAAMLLLHPATRLARAGVRATRPDR